MNTRLRFVIYNVLCVPLLLGCTDHNPATGCIPELKDEDYILKWFDNFTAKERAVTLEYPVMNDVMFHLNESGVTTTREKTEESLPDDIIVVLKQSDLQKFNTSITAVVGIIESSDIVTYSVGVGVLRKYESYILPNLGILFVSLYNNVSDHRFNITMNINYKYDMTNDDTILRYEELTIESITRRCAMLEKDGKWTSRNCITNTSSDKQVVSCTCSMRGISIFGVNQTVEVFNPNQIMHVIYTICLTLVALSDLMLFVAIVLLIKFRKQLHSHRMLIQIGIASSFLGEGLMPLLSELIESLNPFVPTLCECLGVLNLYFDLTTAWWILNEGVILFIKIGLAGFVNHRVAVSTRRMIVLSVCTWLLPAFLVGVWGPSEILSGTFIDTDLLYADLAKKNERLDEKDNATLHQLHKYKKYAFCRPSEKSETYYITSIPLVITVIVNVIIGGYVMTVMWRVAVANAKTQSPRDKGNKHSNGTLSAKAVVFLTWSLGAPNLVTVLLVKHSEFEIVAKVTRVAMIITQGPLVFYFYCVKNTDLINAIKVWKERRNLKNGTYH